MVVAVVSARDPFKVDLRGIVEVLSNHLYSTPDVFVRELLQNGVDAITARRQQQPTHAGEIAVQFVGTSDNPTISFTDDGIGLDETDIHVFLSTIGQSSKREAPSDYLGQFGIGILSCFVVADEVTMVTRKLGSSNSYKWTGHSDGTYELAALEAPVPVGTAVYLRPTRNQETPFDADKLVDLARHYGELLPIRVTFTHSDRYEQIGGKPLPWEGVDIRTPTGVAEMLAYGESLFSERVMAVIPLRSAAADATGLAFLLAEPHSVHASNNHRAYLRRMLVSDRIVGLTPDWAYFVRCVVNANQLRPTAGRESFYEDVALEAFREDIAQILRAWLDETARRDPDLMTEFIRVHHMPLKALATEDADFYEAFVRWLPFEGTRGLSPLGEYLDTTRELHFVSDHDAYRQLAGVARSLGIELIDGGYSYDAQLLSMARELIGRDIRPLDADFLLGRLADPGPGESDQASSFMTDAERVLRAFRVRPILKNFEPVSVPALLVLSDEAAYARHLKASRDVALPMFADVLDSIGGGAAASTPLLVFNYRNQLLRTLSGQAGRRRELAVQLLYVHALLLAHQPLSTAELGLLETATLELLMQGVAGGGDA